MSNPNRIAAAPGIDREAWLEARRQGIGGSAVPVILGLSPYKSIQELYAEKRGLVEPTPAGPDAERGLLLEDIAADMYARQTGGQVRRVNAILVHPRIPYLFASVDRRVVGVPSGGVLEIKVPRSMKFARIKRDGIPADYQAQGQHYLNVTGAPWVDFAVLGCDAWELLVVRVERDEELIALLEAKCAAFWTAVQEGRMPDPETPPAEVMARLPEVGGTVTRVEGTEWAAAVAGLREARELHAEAESVRDAAENRVKSMMERAGLDVVEGYDTRIYFRESAGKRTFDLKSFQKARPDVDVAPFFKTGKPSRSFRVYDLKESAHA